MSDANGSKARPIKRGVARRPKSSASTSGAGQRELMFEGDELEFSITGEVKHPRHGNFWVRTGGKTTIRPGETAAQARERLRTFCVSFLDDSVQQIIT